MDLLNLGTTIDNISVTISYRIIELFSAGLYSSPNKAFEELICNSYDAFAKNVAVYVPDDLTANNAFIWVCDNGEGLNSEELKNLWRIGASNKRINGIRDSRRPQIGQFGIGKLSTYILARKLTYLSKKDSKYLMITMDYDKISNGTGDPIQNQDIILDEKEISEKEAQQIIQYYIKSSIPFDMFGNNASSTWTLSILSDLKPKAQEIKIGRLKWILRTALPLNPDFKLKLNDEDIESSKIDTPIMKEWIIGKEDITAESMDIATPRENILKNGDKTYSVDFDNLKNVRGKITLYHDSLVDGKSANLGRSHGIFLIIRGRLINLDDPLLGMEAFSHGTFNRLRIEVHADELDNNLTSTREAVKDSLPLSQLKEYLKKKINNEARKYYMETVTSMEDTQSIAARLSKTSYNTSKKPIKDFITKFFESKIFAPFIIEKPNVEDKDKLLEEYNFDVDSTEQIINNRNFVSMSSASPICKFDLKTHSLNINMFHPFVANYLHEFKNLVPLEGIAIAEVLTEAHMYQLDIDETIIREIMQRRDNTLREWATHDNAGIPAVAMLLRDSLSNPDGLEEIVAKALNALGFVATKIGGSNKPDGKAEAILGYSIEGMNQNYSLTYDAKSTKKERIAAATAHLAGLKRHQKDYNADYCIEVAIDYSGAEDPESAISKESIQQKVTMLSAKNLMRILFLAVPKQISLVKLRELFETCYSPLQVTEWINRIEVSEPEKAPYMQIIEIIYEKQSTDTEMPSISVVREILNTRLSTSYSSIQINNWIKVMQSLVPELITVSSNSYVSIQCSPSVLKDRITSIIHTSTLPKELTNMYDKILEER